MNSTPDPVAAPLRAAEAALTGVSDYLRTIPGEVRKGIETALAKIREAHRELEASAVFSRQPYTSAPGTGLTKQDSVVERHESFGLVTISKPTGSVRLVGAMAESLPSFVELKVHRARREVDTRLHTEHFYPDPFAPVVTVRMSTYQWAELLCSMTGGGVPCTLASALGVRLEDVPGDVRTRLEQIAHDAREAMYKAQTSAEGDFLSALDSLLARLPELKLSSKKKKELREEINGLRKHTGGVKATAAWAARRFSEDTEATLSAARVEMAAAIQSLVQRSGLQGIAGDLAGVLGPQLRDDSR